MKKSLLTLFLLLPFLSSCSTFSNFFASPPPPAPKYVAPKVSPEKINLNEIKVESINELPTDPLGVYKGSDGNNYLLVNLSYENSGLSIIEAIKSGKILDNSIVVRDQTGKIIGSDIVNFQAFAATEKKLYKNLQEVVRTGSGFETPVRPESNRPEVKPEVSYSAQSKIYTDKEKVPQVIKLNELPPNNSYVSINLELVYVDPFLQQICNQNSTTKIPCTYEDEITKEVREANKKKLDSIIAEFKKTNDKNTEKKSPKKFLLTTNEIKTFKEKMKKKVVATGVTLEGDKSKVATSVVDIEKAKLNYREWSLVSAPKFFQINTTTIKPLIGEAPETKTTPESNTVVPVTTPENSVTSSDLPAEGFSDTVTLKNGAIYKNVKTAIKESTVVITSQDGKSMEIKKTELIGIKR